MNFKQSLSYYSLFIKESKDSVLYLLIYVDDIVIIGNNEKEISIVKNDLKKHFNLRSA